MENKTAIEMINKVFNIKCSDDRDINRIENLMLDYAQQQLTALSESQSARIKDLEEGIRVIRDDSFQDELTRKHCDWLLLPKINKPSDNKSL